MLFQRQIIFWLGAFVLLLLFLWVFSGVLLPFVAGLALAYFLDPVADKLEHWGLNRLSATLIILLSFIMALLLVLVLAAPLLADQLGQLVKNLPGYVDRIQTLIGGTGQQWIQDKFGHKLPDLQNSLGGIVAQGITWAIGVIQSLWAGGQALLSIISLLVVMPVVAFYMLLDWDKMLVTVDNCLPRQHRETVHQLAHEIDRAVAGFIRGQAMVCLILGLFYAVGLTLIGLNFGLLIGLLAGFISFIPFVGSLTGLLLAVCVALVQFWPDWIMVAGVICVFAVGQFIEGNILSPKLVGRSVGLHPVWLMFSLFAFGYLMGFVGLLVAVPLAAAIGVLTRFAIRSYRASSIYDPELIEEEQPPGAGI